MSSEEKRGALRVGGKRMNVAMEVGTQIVNPRIKTRSMWQDHLFREGVEGHEA